MLAVIEINKCIINKPMHYECTIHLAAYKRIVPCPFPLGSVIFASAPLLTYAFTYLRAMHALVKSDEHQPMLVKWVKDDWTSCHNKKQDLFRKVAVKSNV